MLSTLVRLSTVVMRHRQQLFDTVVRVPFDIVTIIHRNRYYLVAITITPYGHNWTVNRLSRPNERITARSIVFHEVALVQELAFRRCSGCT